MADVPKLEFGNESNEKFSLILFVLFVCFVVQNPPLQSYMRFPLPALTRF